MYVSTYLNIVSMYIFPLLLLFLYLPLCLIGLPNAYIPSYIQADEVKRIQRVVAERSSASFGGITAGQSLR